MRNADVDRNVGVGESRPVGPAICGAVAAREGMAQDMYQALWSFLVCVLVTVVVSYMTKPEAGCRTRRLGLRVDGSPSRSAMCPSIKSHCSGRVWW